MDRLPDEIVSSFLSLVTDVTVLLQCMKVCEQWKRILWDTRFWEHCECSETQILALAAWYKHTHVPMVTHTATRDSGGSPWIFHAKHLTVFHTEKSARRYPKYLSPNLASLTVRVTHGQDPASLTILPELISMTIRMENPCYTFGYQRSMVKWQTAWPMHQPRLEKLSVPQLLFDDLVLPETAFSRLVSLDAGRINQADLGVVLGRCRNTLQHLIVNCSDIPVASTLFATLVTCPNLKSFVLKGVTVGFDDQGRSLSQLTALEVLQIYPMRTDPPVNPLYLPPRLSKLTTDHVFFLTLANLMHALDLRPLLHVSMRFPFQFNDRECQQLLNYGNAQRSVSIRVEHQYTDITIN